MGANFDPRLTGNDFIMDGSDEIDVHVWDGTNGSSDFGYRVNQATPTVISLTVGTGIDPDVALVKDGSSRIHALVVYYDAAGSDYILDVLDYASGSFSLVASHLLSANVTAGSSMNIDADDSQNFAIVWSDAFSGKLQGIAGYYSGTTLSLGTITPIGSSFGNLGTDPDICLFGNGTDIATYCYMYSGTLYIDDDDLSDMYAGTNTPNSITTSTPPSGYTYHYPRIACPLSSGGSSTDWTVVFEETNSTTSNLISGITVSGGSLGGKINYNDGSGNSPANIQSDLNFLPVVTYDNQSTSNVYVGWMYDNTSYVNPIVVQCDNTGAILNNVSYLEVSNGVTNPDFDVALSMSGKNGNDLLLLTWTKVLSSEVYTKTISPIVNAGSLKISSNINVIDTKIDLADAKFIEIYDLQGRLIYFNKLITNLTFNQFREQAMQNLSGIYMLKLVYNDGQIKTHKIHSLKR